MKGVVFNLPEAAISRAFGPATRDDLIDQSGVSGAYTSLGNYPDEDIEALVAAAAERLTLDRSAVLRWFGQNAIPVLAELYPAFFEAPDAQTVINGTNNIIDAEVRKLYPGAAFPHFRLSGDAAGHVVMDYISHRNMCALAQGFVEGVAAWYGQHVEFRHLRCKQDGAAHCTFSLDWTASSIAGAA
jgi:hypothetical protein